MDIDHIAKDQSQFPGPGDRWFVACPTEEVPQEFPRIGTVEIPLAFPYLAGRKTDLFWKYAIPEGFDVEWRIGGQEITRNGRQVASCFFDRDYDNISVSTHFW